MVDLRIQEFRFCRGKCHKAFKKHRNPRKVKWTKIARKCLKKELTDDLSQTFEKKRNTLLRYERDTLLKTVEAVPKVLSIKQKREDAFIRKRLMKGIAQRKAEDVKLVNTQMHLIRAPNARVMKHTTDTSGSLTSDISMDYQSALEESMSKLETEVKKEMAKPSQKLQTKKKRKLLAKL
ncbi:large subunit ribosomal protein L24e [Paragonimus westermani]|uniref:Probable ribosome biogenesis protein RLP24 n=1 Tax=Paragonimus westermani TaxID=34504 RepID=A0A5J4NLQ9_9TREM|nr:large subunit ribosomal protein L24e [Paragonimus westermani]